MSQKAPSSMMVFVVRERKEVTTGQSQAVLLLGAWAAPGEAPGGALLWSAAVRPPGPGSILGVSRKAEVMTDKRTGQPEPLRRRIKNASEVIRLDAPAGPEPDEGADDIPF